MAEKGGIAALLGAKAPAAGPAPAGDDMAGTAGVDAAQALIDAVQSGDPSAVFDAFRQMLSAADGMGSAPNE